MIGAELHLDVEAVLLQETTVWQEGSDSAAGISDVTVPLLQCPELVALLSQQGSVSAAPKAHLRIGTWVAQLHQAMSPLVQPGLHRWNLKIMHTYKISLVRPLEQRGKCYFMYIKYSQTFKSSSKTNRECLDVSFKTFSVKVWMLLLHHFLEQNYEKLKSKQIMCDLHKR